MNAYYGLFYCYTHLYSSFQIKERIAALEEANLAEKPWQMGGEATAKSRPENR